MSRSVKSVRVPPELATIDLSGLIKDCEHYLRDLESATLLKAQGNRAAAEALIKARQSDLGRRIGLKVWEARVRFGEQRKSRQDAEADSSQDAHELPTSDEQALDESIDEI